MTTADGPAERVRLRRQLAEVSESWRDAARRRMAARRSGDTVGEAQAQTALEAGFRTREQLVRRLAELDTPETVDGAAAGVRPSNA